MKSSATKLAMVFIFFVQTVFAQDAHHKFEITFSNLSIFQVLETLKIKKRYVTEFLVQVAVDSSYASFQSQVEESLEKDHDISDSTLNMEIQNFLVKLDLLVRDIPKPDSVNDIPTKMLNGPCVNMDFEDGDLNGWDLLIGEADGSVPYSFVNSLPAAPGPNHLIYAGGVDPIGGFPRVNPDGGGFSVRLGNGAVNGAGAARMSQSFLVDATNYFFTYSYAVVFQSPDGHTANERPYFTVRVFDELGANIPCGEYSVIADDENLMDYQSINISGQTVLFKDWATVFTNLSAYIGQNVTIEFTSGDCSLSGHYGYAYVDASCSVQEITATDYDICPGQTSILTAPDIEGTYLWNTGETTQNITIGLGGNYTCLLTPPQGPACSILLDIDIIEFPEPIASFLVDIPEVCLGEPINFTDNSSIALPGSIATYEWNFGNGISTPASNGIVIGVPNTSGTYTALEHDYLGSGAFTAQLTIVSTDGCMDSYDMPITINSLPMVVAGVDQTICDGEQVTLSGSGADSYSWDNGITDGIAFTPAVGTLIYTVTGTDLNACENTDQVEVTVNLLPVVNAGVDQTICDGEQVTLSGSGANSYSWDNGITDGIPFTPAVGTIIYTVNGTDLNGCENTDQVEVTVNALPIVNAGIDQTICENEQVTLNGSGANSYSWDNGITNGVAFTPAVGTLIYTVTGTDLNGCENTDQVEVTVNPLPVVNAGVDQSICNGEQVTLSGSGANSYTWDNGITDGITFTPAVGTIIYTVTGTDLNGCENTNQVEVIVNPLPVVNAGVNQTVCDGEQVTLSGSGANSYSWDNGITDGIAFTPAVGTLIYTVSGTDLNGCENTDQVEVTVNALPIVNAGIDQTICEGEQVTLSGSGANSYSWDYGITNGVPFIPAVGTLIYTVTGTDLNACENTDQVQVIVNPLPVVNAGVDQTICDGEQVTLSGSGANSYSWDNGITDGIAFTPAVGTLIYTVTGTDLNGCENTDQVQVIVNPLPVVNAGVDQTICDGEQVTLSGSDANSYSWDNGITDGIAFTPAVGTIIYTVSGTDLNGCENTDQVEVTVNALPIVNAGIDQTICENEQVTLNGSGANSYSWDNGITNGVAFIPAVGTLIYTVTGTDLNGCENTDQVEVTVNPLPIVNAGVDQTICENEQVTLNGSGANSYSWDNGITNGVAFIPAVGTLVYTVTGIDLNACENSDQVEVTVNPLPIVNAGIDQTICDGEQVTLSGSGANSYSWDNGITDGIAFTPAVGTITCTVIGSFNTGCEATDSVVVTVNPTPIVTTHNVEICEGESATLKGFGADDYDWTGGIIDNVPFYPTISGDYWVTGSNTFNCSAGAMARVTVHELPIASFYMTESEFTTIVASSMFMNTSYNAVNYIWEFNDGTPNSFETNPFHTFPTNEAGNYSVMLTAISDFGCMDSTIRTVEVKEELIFYVPNTFTPDGDGTNNSFLPVFVDGFDPQGYTLYIFNRWGQIVFESHDTTVGWNGLYGVGGDNAQDGTYTWKIIVKGEHTAKVEMFIGHVNLIR